MKFLFLEQAHFDGHNLINSGPIVTKLACESNAINAVDRLKCLIGSIGFGYRMFFEQVPIDRHL